MSEPAEIARGLSEAQREALADVCGCPGLFAGQYPGLETLPPGLVVRNYVGAAGFMGLAKTYPSDLGFDVHEVLENENG